MNSNLEELGMNTKSDELQTGEMNCIHCGKVYRSNIVAAVCPKCREAMKKTE